VVRFFISTKIVAEVQGFNYQCYRQMLDKTITHPNKLFKLLLVKNG